MTYRSVTRRRWNTIFACTTAVAFPAATAVVFWTGDWRFLIQPIGIVALWMFMWRSTPISGLHSKEITSDPNAQAFLASLGAALLVFAALAVFLAADRSLNSLDRFELVLGSIGMSAIAAVCIVLAVKRPHLHRALPGTIELTNNPMHGSGGANISDGDKSTPAAP